MAMRNLIRWALLKHSAEIVTSYRTKSEVDDKSFVLGLIKVFDAIMVLDHPFQHALDFAQASAYSLALSDAVFGYTKKLLEADHSYIKDFNISDKDFEQYNLTLEQIDGLKTAFLASREPQVVSFAFAQPSPGAIKQ